MMGRSWTTKKAERVWKRLRAGVSVQTIAADEGCTITNIHRRLRTAGYSPADAKRAESVEEMRTARIYAARKEGRSFNEIAEELDMEPSHLTTRRLYMRLVRYCERADVPYPHAPRAPKPNRRSSGPRVWAVTDADVAEAVTVLKVAASKLKVYDNERLSLDLRSTDDKYVKTLVAEMRRRRVLADGLVPTGKTTTERLLESEKRTYDLIIKAWADPSQGCETLSSLVDKLGYARHTVNIAIIRLRKLGLVEPRGYLHLRDHA
jgi:DNA-binding MarR family transcriptional regulator